MLVKVPATTLARPYLRPLYDEPEFVVRNIWRLYGGWYDGNPARLKPAADAHVAAEGRVVHHHDVVSDLAVVGDMAARHEQPIVADLGQTAAPCSASIHSDMFADTVPFPYPQLGLFPCEFQILRDLANDGKGIDRRPCPDMGIACHNDVGF